MRRRLHRWRAMRRRDHVHELVVVGARAKEQGEREEKRGWISHDGLRPRAARCHGGIEQVPVQ